MMQSCCAVEDDGRRIVFAVQLRRWQRRQDSLGRNPAGPIGPLSRAFFGAVESAPQELEQWRQHMAVERSGEIQCAEVRRPRGFPPKIGRDLPKIGRSRKRRESARNAASSLFWAARPPLSYFPLPAAGPEGPSWSGSRACACVGCGGACVSKPPSTKPRFFFAPPASSKSARRIVEGRKSKKSKPI